MEVIVVPGRVNRVKRQDQARVAFAHDVFKALDLLLEKALFFGGVVAARKGINGSRPKARVSRQSEGRSAQGSRSGNTVKSHFSQNSE